MEKVVSRTKTIVSVPEKRVIVFETMAKRSNAISFVMNEFSFVTNAFSFITNAFSFAINAF